MTRHWIRAVLLGCATFACNAHADGFFVERAFDPRIAVEPAKAGAGARIALRLQLGDHARRVLLEPNVLVERSLAANVAAGARRAQRLYRGHIEGLPGSWVRLSHTDGLWEGGLWDGREMWSLTAAHELPDAAAIAGVHAGSIVYRGSDAWDRIDLGDDIRRGHAAPVPAAAQPVAKLGLSYNLGLTVVLDTEFQERFDNETARAGSIVNLIDGYYAAANTNVYLNALRKLPTGNAGINEPSNNGTLLDQLQAYASGAAAPPFQAATHLISGKNGISGGLAYVGALCSAQFGIGVSGGRNDIGTTAAIVAHELGHNYGAEHDGDAGTHAAGCPSDGFVMEPVITIGSPAPGFSTCSIDRFEVTAPGFACLQAPILPIFFDGFEE